MRHNRILSLVVLVAALLLLAACGGGAADDPATAMENYLQALADKDADTLATSSCAEWEDMALLELDAFQAVETRLEDVTCSEASREGDSAVITCDGQLIATYNEEDQQFPLSERSYQMLREGGEWRVCGYQ